MAIADYKKAVDLYESGEAGKIAKENLAKLGVQYTPNSGGSSSSNASSSSSSSTSSYSSKGNAFTGFLENIGFEDANYPGLDINIPLSIIISLVITAGITFLASLFLPAVWIVAVVGLALSFMSAFFLNKKLLVILSIIAVIGIGLGVYGFVSKPKQAAAVTQTATATVTSNANFRAEPSTGDNIIRQLQQGDTVTLTSKTSGGWTQIRHGSDTGWVSTEFLNK